MSERPINVILDTDIGSDCDDVMALAYLAYAERLGLARLLAVSLSNGCPDAPRALRTVLEGLSMRPVPIGAAPPSVRSYDHYCKEIADRFSREDEEPPTDSAVRVLRRALLTGGGTILVGIGPLTNLAALLTSEGDDISPLSGRELVLRGCRGIVLMCGTFVKGNGEKPPEWNARLDPIATKTVLEDPPVELTVLPFEVGVDMLTGGEVMRRYEDTTPLSLAFRLFPKTLEMGGRHSWDPATVIYAVEGSLDLFGESPRGRITVDREGRTLFRADETGKCRYLTLRTDLASEEEQKARVAAYIDGRVLALLGKI